MWWEHSRLRAPWQEEHAAGTLRPRWSGRGSESGTSTKGEVAPAWRRGRDLLADCRLLRALGYPAHVLRLHVGHLGAGALEAILVTRLADPREDGPLLFLDVVLEARVHLFHLAHPGRLVRPEGTQGLEQAADLLHFFLVVFSPAPELTVAQRPVARERLVQAGI